MALLRDFVEFPYDKLEEMNLETKQARIQRRPIDQIREEKTKFLNDHKGIKAVTVCFTDLEGRLQMLDYDKKFLLKSQDNLTFDGSSVRGFSSQKESDLRLAIDWSAFYILPSDVFGAGKVLVFAGVQTREGQPYGSDMRAMLKIYTEKLHAEKGITCHVAPEIEGFLFKGRDAERRYAETGSFEYVSSGGYYHSLPGDSLRTFIDSAAEVQRAMGFENEKDHPEVAPSQFEMNFSYAEAVITADQVQLYKLLCRQVAAQHDMTASFLPKPMAGVNGNGMHTNMSLSQHGKNLYWDADGEEALSQEGWLGIDRVLGSALDLCLVLNPSVNAYRRLDPFYEAPNQVKVSGSDRGAMVRIPVGNPRSARIEVRSVAPDVNPYMVFYTLFKTAIDGQATGLSHETMRNQLVTLPSNIDDAIAHFSGSTVVADLLGADVQRKYLDLKQKSADRCARALGHKVKVPEIQFHHEITNQLLWNDF